MRCVTWFVHLSQLWKIDNDIRDTLAKYANDVLEEEEAAPKATVESVEDNVVKVKFN